MSPGLKKILKYFLTAAITLVLLWLAFRGVHWGDFWEALGRCNWWWIIASMATSMAVAYSRGCRWRYMLPGEFSRRECFDAYNVCYLANLGVPRSGEIVRCAMLSSTGRISFEEAVGSMALERTWDMITALLIGVAMFFFTRFGTFVKEQMWDKFAQSLSFSAVWLVFGVILLALALLWVIWRLRDKSPLMGKIWGFFKGLGSGVKAGFTMKHKVPFFLHTIFIWTAYVFQTLFIIYAFPDVGHLGFSDALFLMMVGSLGWFVPVQGGFGSFHFITALALTSVYGLSQQTGLVFATISHESQILQMLINGVISLISYSVLTRRRKKGSAA